MFRDPPYSVRWAGWYVVILGLLQLPLFLYLASILQDVPDSDVAAVLTVYAGTGALIRMPLYILPGYLMIKGFRPAFPVVLILLGGSLFTYLSSFPELLRLDVFPPVFSWAVLLAAVPPLVNLATPTAWKWFLGLGGPKRVTLVAEPRSFELPRRG
jgi:hypothetical protein